VPGLVPVGVSGLQDTIDSRQKAQTYTAEITANDLGGRFGVGVNALIANGYTGQTTEVLALPTDPAPFERVVGVRLASFVSGTSLLLYERRPCFDELPGERWESEFTFS
jgi:hypothetical protein